MPVKCSVGLQYGKISKSLINPELVPQEKSIFLSLVCYYLLRIVKRFNEIKQHKANSSVIAEVILFLLRPGLMLMAISSNHSL